MRPVQIIDIEVAAGVLRLVPAGQRADVIAQLIQDADTADRYRKRLRRLHPRYGDGSLLSAAMCHARAARPASCDALQLECFRLIAEELLKRQTNHLP